MKPLSAIPLLRSGYPLAILAGLMVAGSLPNLSVPGFAWVAPAVMIAAALGKRGSFRIGYVAGLASYLTTLYWLLLIPYRWHGIPFGPALGWLLLGAFLALFPATWVWVQCRVSCVKCQESVSDSKCQVSGHSPTNEQNSHLTPDTWHLTLSSWPRRTAWALSGAAVWVALEMIQTRIFGGFPWNFLGDSQHQLLPLIQITAYTSVYGVSFLLVWFSLSLVSAGKMILRQPTRRSVWVTEICLPMLVIGVVFNLGYLRVNQTGPTDRTIKVTLIQPSIPQTLIWDQGKDDERFKEVLGLCERALTNQTDLLIWPESAIPKLLRWDTNTFEAVTSLARRHHTWIIVGADDAEPRRDPANPEAADYFNSSFLISPEGRLADRYRKRSLVIFGEYIPLQRWMPFLKWFTPIPGGFTPGDQASHFDLPDLGVSTSVLICFEDTFPQLGRTGLDVDFLVNITNDGWFGNSAAQWQHAVTALFRSVENGIPLIRCTNNGFTCWIDRYGRLRQIFRDAKGTIYGAGFMTAEIPVPERGARPERTFYSRHGDLFGWVCVGWAGVVLLLRLWRRS